MLFCSDRGSRTQIACVAVGTTLNVFASHDSEYVSTFDLLSALNTDRIITAIDVLVRHNNSVMIAFESNGYIYFQIPGRGEPIPIRFLRRSTIHPQPIMLFQAINFASYILFSDGNELYYGQVSNESNGGVPIRVVVRTAFGRAFDSTHTVDFSKFVDICRIPSDDNLSIGCFCESLHSGKISLRWCKMEFSDVTISEGSSSTPASSGAVTCLHVIFEVLLPAAKVPYACSHGLLTVAVGKCIRLYSEAGLLARIDTTSYETSTLTGAALYRLNSGSYSVLASFASGLYCSFSIDHSSATPDDTTATSSVKSHHFVRVSESTGATEDTNMCSPFLPYSEKMCIFPLQPTSADPQNISDGGICFVGFSSAFGIQLLKENLTETPRCASSSTSLRDFCCDLGPNFDQLAGVKRIQLLQGSSGADERIDRFLAVCSSFPSTRYTGSAASSSSSSAKGSIQSDGQGVSAIYYCERSCSLCCTASTDLDISDLLWPDLQLRSVCVLASTPDKGHLLNNAAEQDSAEANSCILILTSRIAKQSSSFLMNYNGSLTQLVDLGVVADEFTVGWLDVGHKYAAQVTPTAVVLVSLAPCSSTSNTNTNAAAARQKTTPVAAIAASRHSLRSILSTEPSSVTKGNSTGTGPRTTTTNNSNNNNSNHGPIILTCAALAGSLILFLSDDRLIVVTIDFRSGCLRVVFSQLMASTVTAMSTIPIGLDGGCATSSSATDKQGRTQQHNDAPIKQHSLLALSYWDGREIDIFHVNTEAVDPSLILRKVSTIPPASNESSSSQEQCVDTHIVRDLLLIPAVSGNSTESVACVAVDSAGHVRISNLKLTINDPSLHRGGVSGIDCEVTSSQDINLNNVGQIQSLHQLSSATATTARRHLPGGADYIHSPGDEEYRCIGVVLTTTGSDYLIRSSPNRHSETAGVKIDRNKAMTANKHHHTQPSTHEDMKWRVSIIAKPNKMESHRSHLIPIPSSHPIELDGGDHLGSRGSKEGSSLPVRNIALCDYRRLSFVWLSTPKDNPYNATNQNQQGGPSAVSHKLPSIRSGYLNTQDRTRPQRCLNIAGKITGLSVNRTESRFVVSWEEGRDEGRVEMEATTATGEAINNTVGLLADNAPSFHVAVFDLDTFACPWKGDVLSQSDAIFTLSDTVSPSSSASSSRTYVDAGDASSECFALISHELDGRGNISVYRTNRRIKNTSPIPTNLLGAAAVGSGLDVQCIGHLTTPDPLLLWTPVNVTYLAVVTATTVALIGWTKVLIPGGSTSHPKLEHSLVTVAEMPLEEGEAARVVEVASFAGRFVFLSLFFEGVQLVHITQSATGIELQRGMMLSVPGSILSDFQFFAPESSGLEVVVEGGLLHLDTQSSHIKLVCIDRASNEFVAISTLVGEVLGSHDVVAAKTTVLRSTDTAAINSLLGMVTFVPCHCYPLVCIVDEHCETLVCDLFKS